MLNLSSVSHFSRVDQAKQDKKEASFTSHAHKLESSFKTYSLNNLKANFISFSGDSICTAINALRRQDPIVNNYIKDILNINNGEVLNQVYLNLKGQSKERIRDFFVSCAKMGLKDKEAIIDLSNIAKEITNGTKIEIGADIRQDWLKRILTNPHFTYETKLNAVMSNCKSVDQGQVVKNENLFLNTSGDGQIIAKDNAGLKNLGEPKAYGLFTNDTSFLSDYEVSIVGASPELKSVKNSNGKAIFDIKADGVRLNREQVINKAFFEKISAQNNSYCEKTMRIDIESQIRDIFEIRYCDPFEKETEITKTDNGYILNSIFADDRKLGVKVEITEDAEGKIPVIPEINNNSKNALSLELNLKPGESKNVFVKVTPLLNGKAFVNGYQAESVPKSFNVALNHLDKSDNINKATITLEGTGVMTEANAAVQASLRDADLLINVLNVNGKDYNYIAAGLPRYSCLFGRDSLITSMELLPVNQKLARDTLMVLSEFQGKTFEDRYKEELSKPGVDIAELKERYAGQEEAEGKIMHEVRVGELAREHKIRHTPYYGTVDATALWMMLLSDYHKWTSDDKFVEKLLPKVEKGLGWINENSSDIGFLRIKGEETGNQAWKDTDESGQLQLGEDGKLKNVKYPIAIAEVQGYVYEAKKGIANIHRQLGNIEKAEKLEKEAAELKQRFNKKFWDESKQFIGFAIDGDGKLVKAVTSNPGHILKSGILDSDKAEKVEKMLMSKEMDTGWGIRTLGSSQIGFDELDYHKGSIWPHDNAMIARGLKKENAAKIAKNIIESSYSFPEYRLPELYGGFDRKAGDKDIQPYPESCSPQAWAAGSIPSLLFSCLGIEADGKNNTIKLNNPVLPEGLVKAKLDNMKINNIPVDIEVSKDSAGKLKISASADSKEVKVIQDGKSFLIEII